VVEDHGAAVEDELVLTTDEVDVGEHGRRVGCPRRQHPPALAEDAGPVRRAVQHDDQLRPAGAETGHRPRRAPGVLTDDDADPDAVHKVEVVVRRRRGTRAKPALLVEHAVVGQQLLVPDAVHLAARADGGGVVEVAVIVDIANDGGAAVGLLGDRLHGAQIAFDERRVHEQVLGRVSRECELGEHGEISPRAFRVGQGGEHLGDVAVEIAHHHVELAQGYAQAAHMMSVPAEQRRPGPRILLTCSARRSDDTAR
jgi:hypothetical protein